jgi:hypothetical protein
MRGAGDGQLTDDELKELSGYLLRSAGLAGGDAPRRGGELAVLLKKLGNAYYGWAGPGRLAIQCTARGVSAKSRDRKTKVEFTWSKVARLILEQSAPKMPTLF